MRGKGSDQGGHWPVGIWFAMVGVSAGTVAAFSLIGWTFAKALYGGGDGTEPLDYEPQTVVIEAETPDPAGAAGENAGPAGPGPEPRIAISPAAEPRAERIAEADDADSPRHQPDDGGALEAITPPQLVPVEEEDDPCGPEESGEQTQGGGTEEPQRPDWDDDSFLDELDVDIELDRADVDLQLDRADVDLDLDVDLEATGLQDLELELDLLPED